jgi:hypothetical protein
VALIALPCLALPCLALPLCLASLPCRALPLCLASLPCLFALPCRALPLCLASLPCLFALPCLALPLCLALPCLALPCLALPCLALPCLASLPLCFGGSADRRGGGGRGGGGGGGSGRQSKTMSLLKACQSDDMQIFVNAKACRRITLDVKASDTIHAIKRMIMPYTATDNVPGGVPPRVQRISFNRQQMEDGRTLSDCGIGHRRTVTMSWFEEALEDYMGLIEQEGCSIASYSSSSSSSSSSTTPGPYPKTKGVKRKV